MDETLLSDESVTAVVDRYLRFWNTESAQQRRDLASATFTDGVRYFAPVGVLDGPQSLIDFRDRFAAHMGTVAFRRREDAQVQHGRARLPWEIVVGDGESFATGTDVLVTDADGRITTVIAFLDRAPEGFDPSAHHAEHRD